MRTRDRSCRVQALPSQQPGLVEQYGLTRSQTDRDVWAVDVSGRSFTGAAAVNRVLSELGGAWPLVANLYRLAPLRWIEDRGYRWVAEHRSRIWFWTTAPEWNEAERTPDAD